MIEGDRVRLKPTSSLRRDHSELAGAIGVVGSLFRENGDMLLHVRFDRPLNLVALNVLANEFETVGRIEPRLRSIQECRHGYF